MTTKFDELKRQAMFLRSSPEFYKTDWISDTSTGLGVSTNSAAFITLLKNPDTNTAFYIARHANSSSTFVSSCLIEMLVFISDLSFIFSAITTFKLNVTTQNSPLQIPIVAPAITINGRESKVVVTDYTFGSSSKLLYSTAQIFYASTIDKRDILFLHGDISQDHEAALVLTGTPNKVQNTQSSLIKFTTSDSSLASGETIVSFLPGIDGLVTVWDSDRQLVLYADSVTASTFWSPVIAGPSNDPLANYWGLGTNESILVGGPYLVRDAKLSGSTLALRGDLKTDVRLTVIAPRNVRYITWNEQPVFGDFSVASSLSSIGGFVGHLRRRHSLTSGIKVPKLTGWKYQDSLPEIQESFSDDTWEVANHTTTNIPLKPHYGDGRILYGCDYGL